MAEKEAEIRSSFDPPKSLEELQQSASTPAPGYDIHHVVEKSSATRDGFTSTLIDAPDNLVRIPRWKHWEINAWYQTESPTFGNLTPREYLRGKDWEERRRTGLDALIDFGVLEP